MVRLCESNIIFCLSVCHPSICPSCYLLLNHWAEFNQTCYMTSPYGKGVGEQVCLSVCHAVSNISKEHAQRAHDVYTTSPQRRCNVMTLHRRCGDVVLTSCACWVGIWDGAPSTAYSNNEFKIIKDNLNGILRFEQFEF